VTEYYLVGTQPAQFCPLHQGGSTEIAGWETAPAAQIPGQPSLPTPPPLQATTTGANGQNPNPPGADENKATKKPSLFEKLKSIFH
jgi:hypothetical protein